MLSSIRFASTARRTFRSTFSTFPSTSAHASPVLKISVVYHFWSATALRNLSAAISAACDAWMASTFAIRGTSSTSWADCSAGGIGTSRMELRRDAVSGYELAEERTMDKMLLVSSVVGISSELIDWNRSGCLASISCQWLPVYV